MSKITSTTVKRAQLPELVKKLQEQKLMKRDLVVPASCIQYRDGKLVILNLHDSDELDGILSKIGLTYSAGFQNRAAVTFDPLRTAEEHICEKLQIPKPYFDRLKADGDLSGLDHNVNFWFSPDRNPNNYFVRTFVDTDGGEGTVRAVLSDRYKTVDNYDVLITALNAIKDGGSEMNIEYSSLTDRKMYVRFRSPAVEQAAPSLVDKYRVPGLGDNGGKLNIGAGFVISNSEVGHGSFSISPRLIVDACDNGLIFYSDSIKKLHLGGQMAENTAIDWSKETESLNADLIIAQVKDAVKTFISPEYLGKKIEILEQGAAMPLEHPVGAVRNICKMNDLSDDAADAVLSYFTDGGLTNAFGLSQAVTYYAHKDADPDKGFELECLGVEAITKVKKYDKPEVKSRKKKAPVKPELN